ncbi:MAG TPA: cell division ATP-binding protein FtsE [Burkholderiales bacterium]|nr:cell division ATP-binding protein FtsE [Burkholderiales bacterium]
MISFKSVGKRYGGFEALKRISFSIKKGEMVFVAGHSGAGKSTLLKLLAAIERPTSGSIHLGDQDIGRLRQSAIPYLRRKIGLVFQDHKLLYEKTVFENVALPLQISSFDPRESASRIRAALDKVGLLGREKAHPVELSGGEQQRLCIARAIVNRPSILIADEPTGNLDSEYSEVIMNMFRSFNQVGVTLLISTHDEAMLERLKPRVITLHQGELVS